MQGDVAVQYGVAERLLAAIARAIAYLPLVPFTILITWVYWVLLRDTSPFVERSGRDSLNFQISVMLYTLGLILLITIILLASHAHFAALLPSAAGSVAGLYSVLTEIVLFAVLIALAAFYTVTIAVGIIVNLTGRYFNSPLTIRFFRWQ